METKWIYPEIIRANESDTGEVRTDKYVLIKDMAVSQHGIAHHLEDYKNKKVRLEGYFQHTDYIYYDEPFIRSIWNPDPVEKRPPEEIVLHLRLGDYFSSGLRSVISPRWHEQVLGMAGWHPKRKKLYIVIEDGNDKFLRNYQKFNPVIVSQSAKEDFDFIRSFDTIISSNSSFSWWAAFLSNASTIYTFAPWLRFPREEQLNLAHMKGATPVPGSFCK